MTSEASSSKCRSDMTAIIRALCYQHRLRRRRCCGGCEQISKKICRASKNHKCQCLVHLFRTNESVFITRFVPDCQPFKPLTIVAVPNRPFSQTVGPRGAQNSPT